MFSEIMKVFSKVVLSSIAILVGLSLSNIASAMEVSEIGVIDPLKCFCLLRSISVLKNEEECVRAKIKFTSSDLFTLKFYKDNWHSEKLELRDKIELLPATVRVDFLSDIADERKILNLSNFNVKGKPGRIEFFQFISDFNGFRYKFDFFISRN